MGDTNTSSNPAEVPAESDLAIQLSEVSAERDDMLSQLNLLSAQLNEFLHRQNPLKPESPVLATGTSSDAEKLRLAHRQIEELSRRIVALENIQRNSAMELNREKEARLRAEKILAHAERVQVDTAAHMDATKATIRKEIEAVANQKETELKRVHKELQEQFMYLQDTHRRTLKELESARSPSR